MSKTKEVEFNGTWFYEGTTEPLAELLLKLKDNKTSKGKNVLYTHNNNYKKL